MLGLVQVTWPAISLYIYIIITYIYKYIDSSNLLLGTSVFAKASPRSNLKWSQQKKRQKEAKFIIIYLKTKTEFNIDVFL